MFSCSVTSWSARGSSTDVHAGIAWPGSPWGAPGVLAPDLRLNHPAGSAPVTDPEVVVASDVAPAKQTGDIAPHAHWSGRGGGGGRSRVCTTAGRTSRDNANLEVQINFKGKIFQTYEDCKLYLVDYCFDLNL